MIGGKTMKSNKMKRILVAILCMVVMLSSSISVLAEGKGDIARLMNIMEKTQIYH